MIGLNPLYMGMVFSVGGSLFIEKLERFINIIKNLRFQLFYPVELVYGLSLFRWQMALILICLVICLEVFQAVSRTDLWVILLISIAVIVIVILLYKELFVLSFDEEHAKASGIAAKEYSFCLYCDRCACYCQHP